MTALERNRRMALGLGVLGPLLQGIRVFLWGHPPPPLEWPVDIDGYVSGALLLAGVWLVSRRPVAGRVLLAAGWGFSAGILYRSFFEQLANPARHQGHEVLVMGVKAALLIWSIAGLVGAVIARTDREPGRE